MNRKLALLLSAVLIVPLSALAQQLDLPRPSPNAKVTQTVGLTDISVEYSSPGVHGRAVWGTVVPYGELWRAGANAATKVTFGKDVTLGETAVPAGSYSLFVIPKQEGTWTVIFNKDFAQSGTSTYKKDLDLLRIEIKPEAIPNRERLAYLITDFSNEVATLALEWEKVRLSIPLKLDTDKQVAANLKAVEDGAWSPYNSAANYLLTQKKDYDAGLAYAEKSIKVKETWQNVWTKAQLTAAKGKYKDALTLLQKAQKLADKPPSFFTEESAKQLAEWKKKI
jgi:hypothetical protein